MRGQIRIITASEFGCKALGVLYLKPLRVPSSKNPSSLFML